VFLHAVKDTPGKKILIGDNLASHLNLEVIEACGRFNIEFVCFLPNITDKLQPLDIGIFGPLKLYWKTQLRRHKKLDPYCKVLQKTEFPKMLKELWDTVDGPRLLPAAFEKYGLVPLNLAKAVERIPDVDSTKEITAHVHQTLMKELQLARFVKKRKPKGRGKVLAEDSHSTVQLPSPQNNDHNSGSEDSDHNQVNLDSVDFDELPEIEIPDMVIVTAAYNPEDFDDFGGAGASGVSTPKGRPHPNPQRGKVIKMTVMNLSIILTQMTTSLILPLLPMNLNLKLKTDIWMLRKMRTDCWL